MPTCRGLGLVRVAALSLHCVRRRRVSASPLGTDHAGKSGCQLSHASCVFCEGSFQAVKNLFQLGRLWGRCSFVAEPFDPIFESPKHGPEAEKDANSLSQIALMFDTVLTVEGFRRMMTLVSLRPCHLYGRDIPAPLSASAFRSNRGGRVSFPGVSSLRLHRSLRFLPR